MESSTLDKILSLADKAFEEVESISLPPLSQAFSELSTGDLHSALIRHRILNQYEIPNAGNARLRKQLSIEEVLLNDSNGYETFDYRKLPPHERRHHLLVRQWLAEFFKGFKHTYELRFPTNETYTAARGLTDLFYKLSNLDQWSISPDVVGDVVKILRRNRALAAVVKTRYREKYGKRGLRILRNLTKDFLSREGNTIDGVKTMSLHFQLRATCTLSRVSRVTTVPKNNTRDRVITCESLWTMVAQLSLASSLRHHMLVKLGIDLDTLQGVHRSLIRTGKATIDLSKASDSNYTCVMFSLLPLRIYSMFESVRTGIFEVTSNDGPTYVPLRMYAPMGCGCTFEIMTLMLLAHCRVLDSGSSVFGDDIIITQSKAPELVQHLESHGWKINQNKSFTHGPFRESCGAFCDLRTNSFLESYDLHRPTTLAECFIFGNKVGRLAYVCPPGPLRSILVNLYAKLHTAFPRDSLETGSAETRSFAMSLSEDVFYTASDMLTRNRRVERSTAATRCLEKHWQRPIRVVMCNVLTREVSKINFEANVTLVACYFFRGRVYAIPKRRYKRESFMKDTFSGTPLRSVLLASVI